MNVQHPSRCYETEQSLAGTCTVKFVYRTAGANSIVLTVRYLMLSHSSSGNRQLIIFR